MSFRIAIDGHTAAGKGTLSKSLAQAFGLAHLDTGLLYRAVGSLVLETGANPVDVARGLSARDIFRSDLRTEAVASQASVVAAIPEVRTALLDFQRRFAAIVESVEKQKAIQGAHLAELDILFASLQSRAFRGKL